MALSFKDIDLEIRLNSYQNACSVLQRGVIQTLCTFIVSIGFHEHKNHGVSEIKSSTKLVQQSFLPTINN